MDRREMEKYIDALEHIIGLEEEAHDPDGTLTGLYVALAEAKGALQQDAGGPLRTKVTVWTNREVKDALSGLYEGKSGRVEALVTLLTTIVDLWSNDVSDISIRITKEN